MERVVDMVAQSTPYAPASSDTAFAPAWPWWPWRGNGRCFCRCATRPAFLIHRLLLRPARALNFKTRCGYRWCTEQSLPFDMDNVSTIGSSRKSRSWEIANQGCSRQPFFQPDNGIQIEVVSSVRRAAKRNGKISAWPLGASASRRKSR